MIDLDAVLDRPATRDAWTDLVALVAELRVARRVVAEAREVFEQERGEEDWRGLVTSLAKYDDQTAVTV